MPYTMCYCYYTTSTRLAIPNFHKPYGPHNLLQYTHWSFGSLQYADKNVHRLVIRVIVVIQFIRLHRTLVLVRYTNGRERPGREWLDFSTRLYKYSYI